MRRSRFPAWGAAFITSSLVGHLVLACGSFGAEDGAGSDASTVPTMEASTPADAASTIDCRGPGAFCDDFENGDILAARSSWGGAVDPASLSIVAGGVPGNMLHAGAVGGSVSASLIHTTTLSTVPTSARLELDVRLDAPASGTTLFKLRYFAADGGFVRDLEIVVTGGQLALGVGGMTGAVAGTNIDVGTWTHIELDVSAKGARLMANGKVGDFGSFGMLPPEVSTGAPGQVKVVLGPAGTSFDVDYDNFRFRVL